MVDVIGVDLLQPLCFLKYEDQAGAEPLKALKKYHNFKKVVDKLDHYSKNNIDPSQSLMEHLVVVRAGENEEELEAEHGAEEDHIDGVDYENPVAKPTVAGLIGWILHHFKSQARFNRQEQS